MTTPHHTQSSAELQGKLRRSRILNLVLAFALVFVGGSYAALVWGGSDSNDSVGVASGADGGSDAPSTGGAVESGSVVPPSATDDTEPRLETAPYMTIGDKDAPVVLFEWTDFTCPYCGLFHRDTLPIIIEEYIDTGQVRLEVHDVTFIGPQAEDAAVAARAAGLQDHYFDYLFAVYDLGADGARPDLNRDTLFDLASDLDLDMQRFEADFVGSDLREAVQASSSFAQSLGIGGVPFFVGSVGGSLAEAQNMQGAQPIENVRMFLDAFLEQAGV